MKKAFITAITATTLTLFFSFTNNKPVTLSGDGAQDDTFTVDTVPAKKDTTKKKSGTMPYDSFGKPKKMDTTGAQ